MLGFMVFMFLASALLSPTHAATINVTNHTPNGDGGLGPFAVTVTCGNGDIHNFSLNGGDTTSFTYPDQDPISCEVSETLTPVQQPHFTTKHGDTYGPNNGVMNASKGSTVDGETFNVTNTYNPQQPQGTVTINVEKRTPKGDLGKGPFALTVACQNGDTHNFSLNGGETGSFTYPADTAIDCRISETLTPDQDTAFLDPILGDTYGPSNGRMLANNSNKVADETFFVINSPVEITQIGVEKQTPDGDGGLTPFAITIECTDGDVQNFTLAGGETSTFYRVANEPMNCKINENLTAAQQVSFDSTLGDTYGPDNGTMKANKASKATDKKFYVINKYVEAGGKGVLNPTTFEDGGVGGANVSSSSSSRSNTVQGCSDTKPSNAPHIFQIDRNGSDAVLHITPSTGGFNKFVVSYGTTPSADQHAAIINQGQSTGAVQINIHALDPQATYYFKAQTLNSCEPSDWSNTLSTDPRFVQQPAPAVSANLLPQTGRADLPDVLDTLPDVEENKDLDVKPVALKIPDLMINTSIEHVGLDEAGRMDTPEDPFNAGLFALTDVPGDVGTAVVAAHLDLADGSDALFAQLHRLDPGDEVIVVYDDGSRATFEVVGEEVSRLSDALAQRVFDQQENDREMNLITCAGNWDQYSGGYDQRTVVYTEMISYETFPEVLGFLNVNGNQYL